MEARICIKMFDTMQHMQDDDKDDDEDVDDDDDDEEEEQDNYDHLEAGKFPMMILQSCWLVY